MVRKIITAIDVGSSKIATVITSVEDGKNPTVIGVCSYPSKGIKKGVVVNIDDATSAILESVSAAERMAGVTISDVCFNKWRASYKLKQQRCCCCCRLRDND